MRHIDQRIERMRELVALGVSLAVGHFGTGYSSQGQLKLLPIGKVDIDQSFVNDIPQDADDRATIHAVTRRAHTLHKRVTAEGVENEEQRGLSWWHRTVTRYRAYYFYRPTTPAELQTVIRT